MSAERTVFRLLLLLLYLLLLLIYRCIVLSERNRLSEGKTDGKISLIDSITGSNFAKSFQESLGNQKRQRKLKQKTLKIDFMRRLFITDSVSLEYFHVFSQNVIKLRGFYLISRM